MMDFLQHYSGIIGLGIFFMIFGGTAVWIYRPGAGKVYKAYGQIPLKEDTHG